MALAAHRPSFPALLLAGLVLVSTSARGQTLVRHMGGEAAGDGFARLALIPDVNGDGLPEQLVGAPLNDEAAADAGGAQLRSGADGALLQRWLGEMAGEQFGHAVAHAGDVDGDGLPDVAIGAPGTGALPGRVSVYSGASGALLLEVSGTQAGGRFGAALDGVGDWDGDGLDDLIVGAPGEDRGAVDNGAAAIVSGADGSILALHAGDGDGDGFGSSTSGSGGSDLWLADADPEPVVGAPQPNNGGGYLRVLSRDTFTTVRTLAGPGGTGFGRSVAHLGDLDKDGVVDTAVGQDPAAGGTGSVTVVSGADGAVLALHVAELPGTGFGRAVAAVGDVDGDGIEDVAIGEPDADVNGPDSGATHVFSGADGHRLHLLHGAQAGARAGASVCGAGDVDGDGLADLALGAPGDQFEGQATGTVTVVGVLWGDAGGGVPGPAGSKPLATGHGAMQPGESVTLVAQNGPALQPAVLVIGTALVLDPQGLVPTADVVVEGLVTDADGHLEVTLSWPAELPAEDTVYYQFQFEDSRSNAVRGNG